MESPKTQSPYFMSMADLLIGVLFIFLIIMFYFALNFSKFTEYAEFYEKNKDKIITLKNLTEENEMLKGVNKELKGKVASLTEQLGNAKKMLDFGRKSHKNTKYNYIGESNKIEIQKKFKHNC